MLNKRIGLWGLLPLAFFSFLLSSCDELEEEPDWSSFSNNIRVIQRGYWLESEKDSCTAIDSIFLAHIQDNFLDSNRATDVSIYGKLPFELPNLILRIENKDSVRLELFKIKETGLTHWKRLSKYVWTDDVKIRFNSILLGDYLLFSDNSSDSKIRVDSSNTLFVFHQDSLYPVINNAYPKEVPFKWSIEHFNQGLNSLTPSEIASIDDSWGERSLRPLFKDPIIKHLDIVDSLEDRVRNEGYLGRAKAIFAIRTTYPDSKLCFLTFDQNANSLKTLLEVKLREYEDSSYFIEQVYSFNDYLIWKRFKTFNKSYYSSEAELIDSKIFYINESEFICLGDEPNPRKELPIFNVVNGNAGLVRLNVHGQEVTLKTSRLGEITLDTASQQIYFQDGGPCMIDEKDTLFRISALSFMHNDHPIQKGSEYFTLITESEQNYNYERLIFTFDKEGTPLASFPVSKGIGSMHCWAIRAYSQDSTASDMRFTLSSSWTHKDRDHYFAGFYEGLLWRTSSGSFQYEITKDSVHRTFYDWHPLDDMPEE